MRARVIGTDFELAWADLAGSPEFWNTHTTYITQKPLVIPKSSKIPNYLQPNFRSPKNHNPDLLLHTTIPKLSICRYLILKIVQLRNQIFNIRYLISIRQTLTCLFFLHSMLEYLVLIWCSKSFWAVLWILLENYLSSQKIGSHF